MFICFDTEDNSKELLAAGKSGFDKRLTQIAAIAKSGKRYYNDCRKSQKENIQHFLKWLSAQPEKYVYALNTQYDLGNLFSRNLDDLDCTLVGGRLIRAVWGSKVFYDVFNLYQMSVKALGKAFGLEKLEFNANDKAYVFRDVEIIFRAVDFAWEFAAEMGIENLPATIGGTCIRVWKELGGVNCHDSNPLSKEAYYGGRVELFKASNDSKAIAYTDINSLYPSAMLGDFPGELQPWQTDILGLPKFGIVKGTVKVPKCEIAVLPYRDDKDRILFPYGEFSGTWVVQELKAAIVRGAKLVNVEECYGTNESFRPYKTFVETCYDKRLHSNNESEKLFFKLLMNNLYGRLGTGGVIARTVLQDENNCNDGVCYGEKVLVNYQMPLAKETNWSHAAYVTAYGRLRLLSFIEKIGVENMIYCDTDSCIFDVEQAKESAIPFKCSKQLGEMKLEGFGTLCKTYAPKMYHTKVDGKDTFKAKGVPKQLAQQFIERGRVDFDLPFKLREAIRFYDRNNSRELSVWRKVEKFARSTYDKKKRKHNRYFPLQVVPQ